MIIHHHREKWYTIIVITIILITIILSHIAYLVSLSRHQTHTTSWIRVISCAQFFWDRGQVFTETYTFVDHVPTVTRHVHFILPSVSLFLESFRFCNWEHLLDGVEFLLFLVIEKWNGKIILREFFSKFICLLNLSQGNLWFY